MFPEFSSEELCDSVLKIFPNIEPRGIALAKTLGFSFSLNSSESSKFSSTGIAPNSIPSISPKLSERFLNNPSNCLFISAVPLLNID